MAVFLVRHRHGARCGRVITRENWREIVWPLPAGDMLYVGRAARKLLGQYGVRTIGELAACPRECRGPPPRVALVRAGKDV